MGFDLLEIFKREEFLETLLKDFCNIEDEIRIEREKENELEELMLSMHKHRREEKKKQDSLSTRRSKILFDSIFNEDTDKSTVFIHDLDELFK